MIILFGKNSPLVHILLLIAIKMREMQNKATIFNVVCFSRGEYINNGWKRPQIDSREMENWCKTCAFCRSLEHATPLLVAQSTTLSLLFIFVAIFLELNYFLDLFYRTRFSGVLVSVSSVGFVTRGNEMYTYNK